ncbi:MAG: lamin tail domain-containing protein, partial [Phycisphaerae bacterium]|nr:lamin tail domain-containing protein [Phycisphaerae bacterium]
MKRNCVEIGRKKRTGFLVRILLFTLIFGLVFASLLIAACPEGDLDGNCIVDLDDLLILAHRWLDPNCADPNCGNLDGVNGVTMTDFAKMTQDWQKTGSRMVISEFLAVNSDSNQQEGLVDQDNDSSDWIEIYNPTDVDVNLENWFLTDSKKNLTKWRFPDVTMNAGGYLIVFASEKNHAIAGSELHTNFKLSADGEYLALVMPDGMTVVSDFDPAFPPQVGNISYGSAVKVDVFNLVDATSTIHIRVPGDESLGARWTADDFTGSESWITGLAGIGYDLFGMGSFPSPPLAHWAFDEPDGLY